MDIIKIYQKLPNGFRFIIEKHNVDDTDICILKLINSFSYVVVERIIDQFIDSIDLQILFEEMIAEHKTKERDYL